jgi:hypothetical protein
MPTDVDTHTDVDASTDTSTERDGEASTDRLRDPHPIPIVAAVLAFFGVIVIVYTIGGYPLAKFSYIPGAIVGILIGYATSKIRVVPERLVLRFHQLSRYRWNDD